MKIPGLLPGAMLPTYDDFRQDPVFKLHEGGKIDVGVLWGPIAGYFASRSDGKIKVAPLLHESDNDPPMAFSIVMGVRHGEDAWRRQLNAAIAKQQPAITKILESYGVPLLDDRNRLINAGG